MAVDSQHKRMSAIGCRRLPWFRRFQPVPDGTVDQPDRQAVAFVYSGIEAGELEVTTSVFCFTAFDVFAPGLARGQAYTPGAAIGEAYTPGAQKGQVGC